MSKRNGHTIWSKKVRKRVKCDYLSIKTLIRVRDILQKSLIAITFFEINLVSPISFVISLPPIHPQVLQRLRLLVWWRIQRRHHGRGCSTNKTARGLLLITEGACCKYPRIFAAKWHRPWRGRPAVGALHERTPFTTPFQSYPPYLMEHCSVVYGALLCSLWSIALYPYGA